MTSWKVPLADIDLGEDEILAVTDVLRSRWLSMGPVTMEFERQFADFIGVKHALAVTNCTAALHLAHLALGAGPGDTVICPALTFVATANAIRYTGANPIFADIESTENFNISPDEIEAKMDGSTKGICVVHYGGYPCDMERIQRIAARHHLYVVEDAAHALGAGVRFTLDHGKPGAGQVKKCGSLGDIGCFSFYANKNMTTGEGGMITTNDDQLAEQIRLFRSHGMTSLTWDREKGHSFSYDVIAPGYNYRIDEIRSALGIVQLKKIDRNNQRRMEIVKIYRDRLSEVEGISLPFLQEQGISAYHICPILLDKDIDRNRFISGMIDAGVQVSIHYPPIHTFSEYRRENAHDGESDLPITENIAKRIVTLPLFSNMRQDQIEYVIDSLREWIMRMKETSKNERCRSS